MIRSLTQFHEHERLIAVAQTMAGRFLIWICGAALLQWHDRSVLMLGSFTLILLFPHRRRLLLAIAAIGVVLGIVLERQDVELNAALVNLESIELLPLLRCAAEIAVALVGIYVVSRTAIRFNGFPRVIRQYPLIVLHTLIWAALVLSSLPMLGVLGFTSFIAWRVSYVFAEASRGKATGAPFRDHLFYLAPVFGGIEHVYGKGLDYLTRHEATDSVAFARSQLAGIKVLLLAIVWAAALNLMDAAVYGQASDWSAKWLGGWTLALPYLTALMRPDSLATIPLAWVTIYLELIRTTLAVAASGHVVVGCLRLLGFNIFRNTYKPLLAPTIVEFWNRYLFYFKEILVEFFFYPTYLRCKWAEPKFRLFLAVFAAAFVGNMYFHLLAYPKPVVSLDYGVIWTTWGPRLIYCFLLAFGIWISMLRQQDQRKASVEMATLTTLRKIAGVWTFYAIIRIWNVRAPEIGFSEQVKFTASLFGL